MQFGDEYKDCSYFLQVAALKEMNGFRGKNKKYVINKPLLVSGFFFCLRRYSVSERIKWILLNADGIGQIIAPIFFDV
ncbi:hypothetical protein [Photobacterium kishitanii]|uniref:hypothetical protein n=1 Tax=Photobacterium kishitanii TaxID=318456 RepID=UPI00200CC108|nr:hypothetical protein [Photobacterium kishitanii]